LDLRACITPFCKMCNGISFRNIHFSIVKRFEARARS
jgi:hypothetical protein